MSADEETIVVEPHYLPWHRPVLERIVALKAQQRLPHAILLDASSEYDGAEFLWGLSMLLLCDEVSDGEPCGHCKSCEMMLANTYPDFKYLTMEYDEKKKKINKNINVAQISKLIHEVNLKGLYDKLKIFAIHPAHRMNIESANRLLKTLEEPGDKVLIVLMTSKKGKLPITIRSRCQVWSLELPEKSDAQYWLLGQGMHSEVIDEYLEFANGDPQLALVLERQGYAGFVDQFKQQFGQYLRNDLDIATLASKVVAIGAPMARRLMKMVINAYCYQLSGVDGEGGAFTERKKVAAQEALALSTQIDRQLMIEENNLNFQIQLEDVLISLKQIIKRSKD